MWAAHDAAKVRLLIDRGADVNRGRPDGTTPLISAALRGNIDAMRLLAASGADLHGGAAMAPWRMELSRDWTHHKRSRDA
jgi:hypothetical protein